MNAGDGPLLVLVAVDVGPDDDPRQYGRHGEWYEFLWEVRK
jgi:hypothetical protein